MNQELIDIISKVRDKISDDSDMVWTHYDTAIDLRDELDLYTQELRYGDVRSLERLTAVFTYCDLEGTFNF